MNITKVVLMIVCVIFIISFVYSGYITYDATNVKRGIIRVGTSTPFPPFEENVNGKIVGFDIDIAKINSICTQINNVMKERKKKRLNQIGAIIGLVATLLIVAGSYFIGVHLLVFFIPSVPTIFLILCKKALSIKTKESKSTKRDLIAVRA